MLLLLSPLAVHLSWLFLKLNSISVTAKLAALVIHIFFKKWVSLLIISVLFYVYLSLICDYFLLLCEANYL